MKPKILIPIVLTLVLAGGGVLFLANQKDDNANSATNTPSTSTTESSNIGNDSATTSDVTGKLPKQTVASDTDCSLYDFAQLEPIWGVKFVDMDINKVIELSDGGQLYSCKYNETDSGLGLTVSIEYRAFKSEEAAKKDMANVRDGAKLGDEVYFVQEEQTGVGDEAFFSTPKRQVDNPKNPNKQLYVRKGNLVMLWSAVNLDGIKPTYGDSILKSYKLHF